MKKAIIIGASSGIGKGLAKLLAENDYKVGITGRKTELLEELKKIKPNSFRVVDSQHRNPQRFHSVPRSGTSVL